MINFLLLNLRRILCPKGLQLTKLRQNEQLDKSIITFPWMGTCVCACVFKNIRSLNWPGHRKAKLSVFMSRPQEHISFKNKPTPKIGHGGPKTKNQPQHLVKINSQN